jgi:Tol biopolymer transport system component
MALGMSGIQDRPDAPVGDEAESPRPANRVAGRVQSWRHWWLAIPIAIVVVALAAVLGLVRSGSSDIGPLAAAIRFTLPFPSGTRPIDGAQFAPSPDGTAVVLAARGADGQSHLWIRRLRALDWQELPRTEGALYPFWSPDSQHVGFFANQRLARIDVTNGLTQTICDAPDGHGATWGIQNDIVFASNANGPLSRVPASGGSPQLITKLDPGRMEVAHLWPRFLDDGHRFVYFANTANRRNPVTYLMDLTGGERARIIPFDVAAVPVGDLLLFPQNGTLITQRFDAGKGRVDDHVEAIAGADNVGGPVAFGPGFSVARNVLVYRNSSPRLSRLMWFDRSGRVIDEIGPAADYRMLSLAPDGQRVVVARADDRANTSDLGILDTTRGTSTRLTFGARQDSSPIWSPDAARIVFVSRRDGRQALMTTSAAGGGVEQEIATWPHTVRPTDWSSDGRLLLFTSRDPRTGLDVWVMPVMGDGKANALIQTSFNESDARFSPDGRWVAYVSNDSGVDQVFVRSFPQTESRWQVSVSGGTHPRWLRDGRELLFVAPDGMLTAVGIESGPSFRVGPPRMLWPVPGATDFAVGPDGRFLVAIPDEGDEANQLHVIVNWMSELPRR